SSHVDRSVSADDCDLNVKLLIERWEEVIMKKLSILYVTETSASFSTLFVSFSVTLSQSSTPVSVSDSPALTISVLLISTFTTSALSDSAVSAFIISSLCFKKMLCRLNKLCFSRIISLLNSVEIVKNIYVFENRNVNIILFYTYRYEA
ncbi:hypothetical protein BDBG_16215, partial [Blastomyces gilchristii SLH14081]